MKTEAKKTLRFKEGNRIVYGQDFGWHIGVPHDVDFEVTNNFDGKITLRAKGYGLLAEDGGGHDDYGNGSITVYLQTEQDIKNSKFFNDVNGEWESRNYQLAHKVKDFILNLSKEKEKS